MKKLIFIAIFSVLLASPLAPVRAQVATTSDPMTVEQIQVLLNQLTAIVLDLMQQLADLRAETPADAPTLGATEAPVDEPVALPELVASVSFTNGSAGVMNFSASGNWVKGVIKIKNPNGEVVLQQPADRSSDRFENWTPNTTYTWTLEYSRGEETKTLTGSFTTPSK